MSKEVLVTGGSGYVMSNILSRPELGCFNSEVPTHEEFDFTDLDQARKFVKGKKVVIHAGADTNVRGAKKNYPMTKKINGLGTMNLAIACEEQSSRLVLVSTDMVFSGNELRPGPYHENSLRPESYTSINVGSYGSTKILGEILAEKYCSKLSIVRISYPFGSAGPKDYICKLMESVKLGRPIFCDQVVTPTYLPDLGIALNQIVARDINGIFHVASSGFASPYEIANYVIEKHGLNLVAEAGSCSDYLRKPETEAIPQYGGMFTSSTRQRLGVEFHNWRTAIDEVNYSFSTR